MTKMIKVAKWKILLKFHRTASGEKGWTTAETIRDQPVNCRVGFKSRSVKPKYDDTAGEGSHPYLTDGLIMLLE